MTSGQKKNSETSVIDLGRYGGPIFIGRAEGTETREKFQLSQLDAAECVVEVIIPDNTVTIGSSFFLALFGDSIRKAGSKEAFRSKYHFKGPTFLIDSVVDANIGRALFEGGTLFSPKRK